MRPLTASDIPHSMAVTACGRRESSMMNVQLAFSASPPVRTVHTWSAGMWTEPVKMLSVKSNMVAAMSRNIIFITYGSNELSNQVAVLDGKSL